MSLILLVSIIIRLGAMGWSIVLLRQLHDWRMGFLTVMLALMAMRQSLTLLGGRESWAISLTDQASELPGLAVSLMALLAIFFLERIIIRRKSVEEALGESEKSFRALLQSASEAIVVVGGDSRIVLVNSRTEEMFGYNRVELIGQAIETLIPARFGDVHSRHRREYLSDPRARSMGLGLDLAARHKDGNEFPVEISLSSIETDDGILVMSLITNITQRVRAEEALREERDKAQRYLDVAGVIFVVIGVDGKVSLINKKGGEILGYNENEILGKNWFDNFIPERFRGEIRTLFQKLMTGDIESVEYYDNPVLTKSGVEKIISWHNTVLSDESGNFMGTLSSGEDITERVQVEEQAKSQQQQLMQADKMATLGILVSGVAHEINNPNNYILLNAKIFSRVWNDVMPILKEYYEKNGDFVLSGMPYTKAHEKIGQLVEGISEGSMRIQKIVESLKDFARQDRDDLNQLVDINSVIESAIVIVDNLINKSTDHFSVQYGKGLPSVRGNVQQLEQVAINLITNSCQALQSVRGSLSLSTSYDKGSERVVIKVCDEGEGISPENMKRIFDPFFTTKLESKGTGLGLSVSYNIIKNHGGDLSFSSKIGKGTTALLTLPANHNSSHLKEVK